MTFPRFEDSGCSRAPRVAVIIPSYDRTSDLGTMLEKLVLLDGEFDVYVFDDCSPHERIRDLCAAFPRVVYRRSEKNLGVIGIRNYAMNGLMEKYDIFFHFDDDSIPLRRDHIPMSLAIFEKFPDLGVLAFPIVSPGAAGQADTCHSKGLVEDIFCYVGCGNAWRVSAIKCFGLFSTVFERQGEEVEHSFRVWKSGYRVMQAIECPVLHWQSTINRNQAKNLALSSTAYLKWVVMNWPIGILFLELIYWTVFSVRRAHRISWRIWFGDLRHPQHGLGAAMQHRDTVPSARLPEIRALYSAYRTMIR